MILFQVLRPEKQVIYGLLAPTTPDPSFKRRGNKLKETHLIPGRSTLPSNRDRAGYKHVTLMGWNSIDIIP